MRKRRITGLYMLRRLEAARGSVRLGQSLPSVARSHGSLHPHFGRLQTKKPGKNGFLAIWFAYPAPKTSYTAGTLSERKAKYF